MQIRSVGIDLGKTTFHLVALGDNGKVLLKKKFTQKQLIAFTANLQTTLIGLEACGGAHFLGRTLREQGHDVKLIPTCARFSSMEPALSCCDPSESGSRWVPG
jgi:transposase